MDILFSFLGVYFFMHIADRRLAAKGHRGEKTDHFDGKRFHSYGIKAKGPDSPKNTRKMLWRWILSRTKSKWKWRENGKPAELSNRVEGSELRVTFINHSTFLVQTEGLNILTDPIWSRRASPWSAIGPKRFREPGIAFDDLPPIDIVLISHNHYDHMDFPTLKRIHKRWNPKIYVGLGNAEHIQKKIGIKTEDMDWWDAVAVKDGVRIVCAPGQHFSSRAFSDRNKTLWCGFIIETPHGSIFFAGDTGYGSFVGRINEKYSEFRLALLPIGAFRPEWFMGPVHISPGQAMRIHQELNVRTSMGMHFGTFRLADDHQDEPPQKIKEIIAALPTPKPNFIIPEHGESYVIS